MSLRKTLEFAHEEPEFLEFYDSMHGKGGSTLYTTSVMIGKTRILPAFGKITVAYEIGTEDEKEIDYEIKGNEVFIDGHKCTDTQVYIREPDYLYMNKSCRFFNAFKERFDKEKFQRMWVTPVPDEPTRVVRHFEIYFGKSVSDVYVMFDGGVYSEQKVGTNGDIMALDLGWTAQKRVLDREFDLESALIRCKDPIVLEAFDESDLSNSDRVQDWEEEWRQRNTFYTE